MNLNEFVELIRWMANGCLDLFYHAAWSGVASLLSFWLTLWAMRGMYFTLACLLRSGTSMPTALERDTRRLGYLAALFFALSAHMWWDRLLGPF